MRSMLLPVATVVTATGAALLLRHRMLRWGATDEEISASYRTRSSKSGRICEPAIGSRRPPTAASLSPWPRRSTRRPWSYGATSPSPMVGRDAPRAITAVFDTLFGEPAHLIMQARQFHNLAQRVRSAAASDSSAGSAAAVATRPPQVTDEATPDPGSHQR